MNIKKIFITLLFCLCFTTKIFAYQKELAICAIFQNEAPYLKEWIEFHKIQGVQHFYLYNNRSTDHPETVLKEYVNRGEITLINWTHEGQVIAQDLAYKNCLKLTSGKVKWVAFIDTDEFLYTPTGTTLTTFLKKFETRKDVAGVCINWQMYGTSGVQNIAPGELMVEKLIFKGPHMYHENIYIKSIIRPDLTVKVVNPHVYQYKKGYRAVDSNFKTVDYMYNADIPIDQIRINHYWCRTLDFAYTEKMHRIMKCYNWSEYAARGRIETFDMICSSEEDYAIGIYTEALRSAMGF